MRSSRSDLARILAVVTGVFMIGIAVGLFQLAEMGADPFSAMNTGISSALGMQFGTLQLLVNAGILVLVFLFKRKFIGFGTIFNMIFVGYTADLVKWLAAGCGFSFSALPVRTGILVIAAPLVCMGAALYISADMGMSPYDASGYVVESLTKIQFRFARIILDILCVCIAFFTGAKVGIQWKIIGIGTVLLTLCTGPLIQFFRVHWSDPLLAKAAGKERV